MRLNSRIFSSVSSKTFFVGSVVALAIGAFTMTGVGSLRQLDASTAGSVGSQLISMRQMQEVLQNVSRQNPGDTPEKRNENVRQAMNQLVEQKVLIEEAVRLGFEANDVEVASWIKKIPAFQNKETKKFDNDQYEKFMKTGQVTALELYRQGRDAVTLDKYYQMLSLFEPSPTQLKDETEKRNKQEFYIETAALEIPQAKLKEKVRTEAAAFLKDPKNLEELKKSYEATKSEFTKPAQVEIMSILISHKDANRAQGKALQRDKKSALDLSQTILKDLQKGADFSQLAVTHSDDPTVKSNKGRIGFVDKSTIDEATSAAAFALNQQNPLSAVIDTPFGYRNTTRWKKHLSRRNRNLQSEKSLRAHGPP
jgi:peptidyl-prolyl cis-trans isomerase D